MNSSEVLWVTGYQGFIGSQLIEASIDQFKMIGCLGRGNNYFFRESSKKIKIDGDVTLENLKSLKKKSLEPNIILHLAGCSSVTKAEKNIIETSSENIYAISSLLEFCRFYAKDTLVIVISSPSVFGQNRKVINMKSDEKPVSIYGLQKSFSEQISNYYNLQYGIRIKIARIYSCYGEGLKKQFLWDLCQKLTNSRKPILWGTGNEIRDFIHVKDTINALKLFMHSKESLRYLDIGNGQGIKINDIANIIYKNLQVYYNGEVQKFYFSGIKSKVNPIKLVADTVELYKLGYNQSMPFNEGADAYCRWFSNLNM